MYGKIHCLIQVWHYIDVKIKKRKVVKNVIYKKNYNLNMLGLAVFSGQPLCLI